LIDRRRKVSVQNVTRQEKCDAKNASSSCPFGSCLDFIPAWWHRSNDLCNIDHPREPAPSMLGAVDCQHDDQVFNRQGPGLRPGKASAVATAPDVIEVYANREYAGVQRPVELNENPLSPEGHMLCAAQ